MDFESEVAPPAPLRLVTDEMADQEGFEVDARNLAITRRLVNNPEHGITRITVVGLSGTYLVEPANAQEPTRIDHSIPNGNIPLPPNGLLAVLRRRLGKKANS